MQSVVTGFATLQSVFVIETRDAPGGRHMAGFAFLRRLDMVAGLAFSRHVVMARETSVFDVGMVDVDLREVHLVVAISAIIAGLRMVQVLALGHVAVVAAGAIPRRALEDGTLVAGFAGYPDVHAFQWKPRGLVVEILVNLES